MMASSAAHQQELQEIVAVEKSEMRSTDEMMEEWKKMQLLPTD